MPGKIRHSPLTAREHPPLPCGYAPRALHLSYDPLALFVGAKDGSIQAVVAKGHGYETFPLKGCTGSGVRALSEWQSGWLWVGRRGGEVELVDVRKPKKGVAPKVYGLELHLPEKDPVRALGWVDDKQGFLSFQKNGTWVVKREEIGKDSPEQPLSKALANKQRLQEGGEPLCEILFVVPFERGSSRFYVMANKRGEVFVWDGGDDGSVRRERPWAAGEEPGFVNDFTIFWADRERGSPSCARGVFLATDRGVHLLHATGKKDRVAVRCRRLALPGLGAVCMAITYAEPAVEPKNQPFCYLWAADTRGDGHLYWAARGEEPARINFLPSGLFHAGSQSMLATSWWEVKEGDSYLVVCEARRNDEIVLTEYSEVGRHQARNELEEIRRLLSHGDTGQIAGFWKGREDLWVPSKLEEADPAWPPYAQLSELFELLAEKTDGLAKLLEFLGDPSAEAARGILCSLGTEEECRTAIELWTLSLLGVLNRASGKLKASERDSGYLGIIRWLRDLHRLVDTSLGLERKLREAILRSIDTSISMVRKWGLFGEANARRENLIRPLLALQEQVRRAGAGQESEHDQTQVAEADLDLLTYEVLLFERGVTLRDEDRTGNLPGRNGWDVSFQQLWGRDVLAVSWHWGWVELYELKHRDSAAPKLVRHQGVAPLAEHQGDLILSENFHVFSAEDIGRRDMQAIPKPQSRHSRAVLLGRLETRGERERAFLLTAPTQARSRIELESLHLWEIQAEDDSSENDAVVFAGKSPFQLRLLKESEDSAPGESVSSFLDLGSGWVLVGLSGQGGLATCQLVHVVVAGDGSLKLDHWPPFRDDPEKKSKTSDSEANLRNRVWSLAQVEQSLDSDRDVLAGCEDGSIRRMKVHLGPEPTITWSPVTRMRSAVKALAGRYIESKGYRLLRLLAGGANGSLLAWQEVRGDEETVRTDGRYASLWAVHEGEEIAGIHFVEVVDRGTKTPLVLAITRDERFVFFNDLDVVGSAPFKGRPKRIPLPGCRHGTLQRSRQERASAFATCVVPPISGPDSGDLGRVAAVLTASKHGVLRLLSLHYPHFLKLRTNKFVEILQAWDRVVRGDYLLRLVHTAYRTAPSLELILVRWLLDPAWPENVVPRPAQSPVAWKVPRNLRQLVRLSEAWASADADEVYKSLLAALREAFRLDDLLLYQEICEVALHRGNCELSAGATEGATLDTRAAPAVYLRVFEAIEESIQQWRGGVNQEESLARMNVARNLVDGDTFIRLANAVAQAPGAFDEVVSRRIRGVRDLILKGNSRVTLEALRAANLSMLRLCKRLQKKRAREPKAPLSRLPQLRWNVFRPYFEVLTAAAARTFHSPLELTDVAEHSYARAFALAVCACPSAALRIATRLTETRLISDPDSKIDLCWLVPRQFEVLAQIGIEVPTGAQELFRIGARPPQKGLDPLRHPWLLKNRIGRADGAPVDPLPNLWEELGTENARDLACLWRLYGLVNWFTRLERMLSYRPDALTRAAWQELEHLFESLRHPDVETLYGHSLDFWRVAVNRFYRMSDLFQQVEGAPIEPRLVLFSRGLVAWASESLEDLERRQRESAIFQPEHAIFREVLERLRRSAERFPDSAAVRMNVVRGVLGHHLLEDLDEHLFELQEIAHVLDPIMVRRYREDSWPAEHGAGAAEPVAQRFAEYLMTRSERAESLPENLRTLFSLLDRTGVGPDSLHSVKELLEPFENWQSELGGAGKERVLDGAELRHLGLVLKELDLNDEKHSRHGRNDSREIEVRMQLEGGLRLEIEFRFTISQVERTILEKVENGKALEEILSGHPPEEKKAFLDGNVERLMRLQRRGLQTPIEPRKDRRVASSGMGLYVANFAAAIVNWELEILRVAPAGSQGSCVFQLTRKAGDHGSESAA